MKPGINALLLRGLLVAALVVVVGAGIWLLRPPEAGSVTLTNGIHLRVVGTSYGTNHFVRPGGAVGSVFGRWIGFFFPRHARPGPLRYATPTPRLVVYLQEDASASRARRQTPVTMKAFIEDEQGVTAGNQQWLGLGAGLGLHQVEFEVVPHRSRRLRVVFGTPDGPEGTTNQLGHLTLPNPAFRDRPRFKAQTLPATATKGELEATLGGLVFGVGDSTRSESGQDGRRTLTRSAAVEGEEPRALAVFQFREAGSKTAAWVIGALKVATAVSDRINASSSGWNSSGSVQLFSFSPVPWPEEPWQLDVWAKRVPTAVFAANELMIVGGVEVPGLDQTNLLARVLHANGVEIRIESFVHRAPPDRQSYFSEALSRLVLEIPELPEGHFVDLVRAVDAQGRSLESGMTSTTHSRPIRVEYGFLQVPEGAQTLEFTLAIQRGRPFRFTAKPELVGTNGFVLAGED